MYLLVLARCLARSSLLVGTVTQHSDTCTSRSVRRPSVFEFPRANSMRGGSVASRTAERMHDDA